MEKSKVVLLAIIFGASSVAISSLLCGILFTLNMPRTWSENSLETCEHCGAHVMEVWHCNENGTIHHVCSKCADMLDTE